MKTTAGIVLAVFAIMALGSFAGIANDHRGIGECIASTIQRGACPDGASLFELVSFHTGAYGAFSLALAASFAALSLLGVAHLLASAFLSQVFSSLRLQRAVSLVPHDLPAYQRHIRALARYEHSPTV